MLSLAKSVLRTLPYLPTFVNGKCLWFPKHEWGAFRLSYEPEVACELLRHFRTSNVFIDIGAHSGIWAVWAAKMSPELRVIAYEPGSSANTFETFAALNRVTDRVILHRKCITTVAGFVQFYDSGSTRSGLDKDWAELAPNQLTEARAVAAVTLSDAIHCARSQSSSNAVITIKCDIEGHEHQVLNNTTILEDRSLQFVIELHGVNDVEQCEIVRLAKSVGRECRTLGTYWGGTVTVSL